MVLINRNIHFVFKGVYMKKTKLNKKVANVLNERRLPKTGSREYDDALIMLSRNSVRSIMAYNVRTNGSVFPPHLSCGC